MNGRGAIRADRFRATESLYGALRSTRPSDLHGGNAVCPFCPGQEHRTGALMTADPGANWTSRVIANLYPAVEQPDGRHEVIVEVRDHAARWTELDPATIERVLGVYHARERAALDDGYPFVCVFKNSGAAAGASLAHPHAQVIALAAIPLSIAVRLERLTPDCHVCETLAAGDARVVVRRGDVVAYVPDGSRTAFEVRFAGRVHAPRFSDCSAALLGDLAGALRDVLGRLAATLGERLPFNMIVQSAPRDARAGELMHWEIELVPRAENFGGFELGTGGFVVSRSPEDAARVLRAAGGAVDA